jgi:hypothetical protein
MLNAENQDRILFHLDEIRRLVHVWPPQGQQNTIGSKWQLMQNLDTVAARSTFSARPSSRLLENGQPLPEGIVIKRTHSDAGRHVLLPENDHRSWEYLNANSEIPGCRWFGQTYVETLHRVGEWRVFIVGGRIVYTVHTVWNPLRQTWKWDIAREFHSLETLTCIFPQLSRIVTYFYSILRQFSREQRLFNTEVCNPDQGSVAEREKAQEEFQTFVTKTYEGLYEIESRVLGGRPSIGIFCRMDIGLIRSNGSIHYFVNEVERNQTTSLWSNNAGVKGSEQVRIGVLGQSFADALYRWLSDLKRPYQS